MDKKILINVLNVHDEMEMNVDNKTKCASQKRRIMATMMMTTTTTMKTKKMLLQNRKK